MSFPFFRHKLTRSYSTVRPVKKVDAAGSVRLSNEFIGTGSVRRAPDEILRENKLDSPTKARAPLSAKAKAGKALVEEVVLGVLDSVCLLQASHCAGQLIFSPLAAIWMRRR